MDRTDIICKAWIRCCRIKNLQVRNYMTHLLAQELLFA